VNFWCNDVREWLHRICALNEKYYLIILLCVPIYLYAGESDVIEGIDRHCSIELKIRPPNLQANINSPIGQSGGGVNSEVTCKEPETNANEISITQQIDAMKSKVRQGNMKEKNEISTFLVGMESEFFENLFAGNNLGLEYA